MYAPPTPKTRQRLACPLDFLDIDETTGEIEKARRGNKFRKT